MMYLPEPQGWQSYFMLVTIQSCSRRKPSSRVASQTSTSPQQNIPIIPRPQSHPQSNSQTDRQQHQQHQKPIKPPPPQPQHPFPTLPPRPIDRSLVRQRLRLLKRNNLLVPLSRADGLGERRGELLGGHGTFFVRQPVLHRWRRADGAMGAVGLCVYVYTVVRWLRVGWGGIAVGVVNFVVLALMMCDLSCWGGVAWCM